MVHVAGNLPKGEANGLDAHSRALAEALVSGKRYFVIGVVETASIKTKKDDLMPDPTVAFTRVEMIEFESALEAPAAGLIGSGIGRAARGWRTAEVRLRRCTRRCGRRRRAGNARGGVGAGLLLPGAGPARGPLRSLPVHTVRRGRPEAREPAALGARRDRAGRLPGARTPGSAAEPRPCPDRRMGDRLGISQVDDDVVDADVVDEPESEDEK